MLVIVMISDEVMKYPYVLPFVPRVGKLLVSCASLKVREGRAEPADVERQVCVSRGHGHQN